MTDKVQKIREEVEKLHGNPYYMMAVKDVLEILDMQEEPVSEKPKYKGGDILYKINDGSKIEIIDIVADQYKFECGDEYPHYEFFGYIEHNYSKNPVSDGLENAAFDYAEACKYDGVEKLLCVEHFKAGAKWQKEHLWKHADGDDLPEIDREVVALTQPYTNDERLRVVFAHRPNKYTKVWNSDLGEEQVVEIERHGKGGWNIPDIVYWLDVELPKEIEL